MKRKNLLVVALVAVLCFAGCSTKEENTTTTTSANTSAEENTTTTTKGITTTEETSVNEVTTEESTEEVTTTEEEATKDTTTTTLAPATTVSNAPVSTTVTEEVASKQTIALNKNYADDKGFDRYNITFTSASIDYTSSIVEIVLTADNKADSDFSLHSDITLYYGDKQCRLRTVDLDMNNIDYKFENGSSSITLNFPIENYEYNKSDKIKLTSKVFEAPELNFVLDIQ